MYSYALSLNYHCAEDPKWFEAVSRSKVRRFEFGAENAAPPEAYAVAVDNILRTASTIGVEAASVHIPFGDTPWVPSRESERAIALEAIRGLMRAWSPLRPQRYTLHGCTEADVDVPHSEQMRALRVFLSFRAPASATRRRNSRRLSTAFRLSSSASASTSTTPRRARSRCRR